MEDAEENKEQKEKPWIRYECWSKMDFRKNWDFFSPSVQNLLSQSGFVADKVICNAELVFKGELWS